MGLGLPICERIIKNHGGRIEVESTVNRGTTFKVYLPLVKNGPR
jgi:signal transduction histidine kinase